MSNHPKQTTEDLEVELAIADELREKMASILTRSVNAVRGEPAPLHRHSWRDLPELIDQVNVDLLEALLDKAKADETITRLQGEAAVMVGLLTEAVAVLQTIDPECATEDESLTRLRSDIWSVLTAWAKRGVA